jgi:hypothetical protein
MTRQHCVSQLAVLFAVFSACFGLSGSALAQPIAFDGANPSDPDYSDGFLDDGDNGGFGFGPWSATYGNPVDFDLSPTEPDNDLTAPSFRLGTGSFGYGAARTITAPIQVGQSFSIDFDQFSYSFPDPVPVGYFSNDSLIRLSSAGGERFALYNWYAAYNDGLNPVTYFNSSDQWGISAASAFDNLNGGAPLPTGGAGFMTGYTGPDSTDGFIMRVDVTATDSYRVVITDDGVTKVDVSGALRGGATTGQGINNLYIWSSDGSPATIDTSYFTNMQVIPTPVPPGNDGDYNDDGEVDAADYVLWRKLNGTSTDLPNDPNPLPIDMDQYNTWRANFGESGSGTGGTVVPEPSTIAMIVIGFALLLRRRRSG